MYRQHAHSGIYQCLRSAFEGACDIPRTICPWPDLLHSLLLQVSGMLSIACNRRRPGRVVCCESSRDGCRVEQEG